MKVILSAIPLIAAIFAVLFTAGCVVETPVPMHYPEHHAYYHY